MANQSSQPAPGPKVSPAARRRAAPKAGTTDFVFRPNPVLLLVCAPARFSLAAAAGLTGVHPELLRYYCRIGVIAPHGNGTSDEPVFDAPALEEVRRVEHYRRHLGVCRRALPLLCALRRESERLHIELHFLNGR